MVKKSVVLLFITGMLGLHSCYKIEPYTPDPDKVYVPGKRIKPRVEKEFVQNPSLRVQLGTIVVLELEHLDSPSSAFGLDTESIGVDQVRYQVDDTTNLVFRRDESSSYSIEFIDEKTNEIIFNAQGPGEDIQVHLKAGKYLMKVYSNIFFGIDTVGYQMLFIQAAKEPIAKAGLGSIEPAYWFITTKLMSCVSCDLAGLDFQGQYLLGADLDRSDLSNAILTGADLKTARITHGKLNSVRLNEADMRGINLSFSEMRWADIRTSDLSYSILNATDLTGAKAYGTNFCFATKNGWIVQGILVDGNTQCFP